MLSHDSKTNLKQITNICLTDARVKVHPVTIGSPVIRRKNSIFSPVELIESNPKKSRVSEFFLVLGGKDYKNFPKMSHYEKKGDKKFIKVCRIIGPR